VVEEGEPRPMEQLLAKATTNPHAGFLQFLLDRGERYNPED
jgi:hypothetical protein